MKKLIVVLLITQAIFSACVIDVQVDPTKHLADKSTVSAPVDPGSILADIAPDYRCQTTEFPINFEETIGARSIQVEMESSSVLMIDAWIYRPFQEAIREGKPRPTVPPDGYDPEFLPTDYAQYRYDLSKQTLMLAPSEELKSFRSDTQICRGECEQQVLDQSPNGQWQLVMVRGAWNEYYNGLYLVGKKFGGSYIAPFGSRDGYRTSQVWWEWQNNSNGLFWTYRTAGDVPFTPMYIRLSTPLAYSYLEDGVHFQGSHFSRSYVVDQNTILLQVFGSIVLSNGQSVTKQWYVFDSKSGTLREAKTEDFATFVKYLLIEEQGKLIKWGSLKHQQWLNTHPNISIWDSLGEFILFAKPYWIESDKVRFPLVTNSSSPIRILDCSVIN